ncbi:MAG TPA: hypothetical protein VN428_22745 [Bryobacteraceae bacterium]|nr:hypothetical protein [Bryobacteraceae bacterium]
MPPPKPTAKQIEDLHKNFEATDEYKAWEAFVKAVEDVAHNVAPRVEVPTAFLRLAALDIAATPFSFSVMRKPWNRICDELGPELNYLKKEPYGSY